MSVNYGFKVCRVCLTPEPAMKFKSMIEGRGEMGSSSCRAAATCFFQISHDRGIHEVLICTKCSEDVKRAFDLVENIRRVDAFYLQARREEAYEADFVREPALVKGAPAEIVFQGEGNNAPSRSRSSSGAEASRMPSQVQCGAAKPKSFETTAKPNRGKSFKCHVCDKNITTKFYLRQHIEMVHGKIKNFACDFCPYKCSIKNNLSHHIVHMHMSAESCPKLKCEFKGCKKSFRTSNALNQHKKAHSNHRPFKCSACLKTFKYNQDVKRHHQKNRCTSKD